MSNAKRSDESMDTEMGEGSGDPATLQAFKRGVRAGRELGLWQTETGEMRRMLEIYRHPTSRARPRQAWRYLPWVMPPKETPRSDL